MDGVERLVRMLPHEEQTLAEMVKHYARVLGELDYHELPSDPCPLCHRPLTTNADATPTAPSPTATTG